MDDGEEELYQTAEPEEEPFDDFAIPDEADQMGVPDAVRFEQEQRRKEQEIRRQQESGESAEGNHGPSVFSDGAEGKNQKKNWFRSLQVWERKSSFRRQQIQKTKHQYSPKTM